ncbi:MAG: glycosyltransferase [Hyphomicrobiales bacterium]|nr:glycosyltransferase [Hyphomicrobiales bacterium]
MKVVHLHFGTEGGAERFFVNLANSLCERGIEQKFVIRPGRIWRDEISDCGEIIENHFRSVSLSQYWLKWKVNKMAHQFKPDAILAWMPRASRLMPDYKDAIKITRLGDYPANLKHFTNIDVLLGITPEISRHCKNLVWNKRIETIPLFAKELTPVPVSRASLDTPEDVFVISCAGRFDTRKGMDTLIRAVSKLDNAYLWLLGDGSERENFVNIAREVGMSDRLRMPGWQKEPFHTLASSDIFCFPSRHEPFGNSGFEAWRLGLPLVSARSQGPSWYVRDGENGLMVDIDDVDGFAAAFERLRNDPKLCETLVAGGHKALDTVFSKKAVTDQFIDLFSGKTVQNLY